MTGDVSITLDGDAAAVLLDWLRREDAIDAFKWAAARPGDRVALMSLFAAANNAGAHGDVTEARERLESTLPPERTHGIPEEVLRHAPDHVRRHLLAGPPVNDIVSRVAERLEMLGASHTGVGWRTEGEHGYLEVGLDPYSEDAAQRVRLMCEPVEVRFVQGPRRPPGPFGRAPDDV